MTRRFALRALGAALLVPAFATSASAQPQAQPADGGLLRPLTEISAWRWNLVEPAEGRASLERDADGDFLRAETIRTSDKVWHVQFGAFGVSLQNGVTYVLTFRAKASAARTVGLSVTRDVANYQGNGLSENPELSTDWQPYSFTFTAKDTLANHSRVNFTLGNATGTVFLRDFSLRPAAG